MKKCIIFAALMLGLLLVAGCDGQQNAKSVAIVNISQVFQESKAAKAGMKYLEDIGDEMQKEFLKLQQDMEKDPNNAEKQKVFNESLTAFQGRLNAEQQQVLTKINDAFQEIIDAYREKHKIAVILRSDQVVSMDPAYDVTTEIVNEMNKLELTFTPIEPAEEKIPATPEKNSQKDKQQGASEQDQAAEKMTQGKADSETKAAQKEKAAATSTAKAGDVQNDKADTKKK